MGIKARIQIIGKNPPVETPQEQPKAMSFSDLRKQVAKSAVEPVVEAKVEEPPVVEEKPLVMRKNINTEYSDILDVSKPSKYTEHFLK